MRRYSEGGLFVSDPFRRPQSKELAIPSAPIPANEAERIAALRSYAILDSGADSSYDAFARLAADVCETPMAFINLVDTSRTWFKANVGLPGVTEAPRDIAFCSHAVGGGDELLEIGDTALDERFAQNPLVIADPNIRFYAGAPLIDSAGNALGTICTLDRRPRVLSEQQREGLRVLAGAVGKLIEARKGVSPEHLQQLALLNSALERAPEAMAISRVREPGTAPEFVSANSAFTARFGYTLEEIVGKRLSLLCGPQTESDKIERLIAAAAGGESGTEIVSLYTSRGARLIVDVRERSINPSHRVISFRDLTRLAATQAALADSNNRLASVLRHNNDAVLTLDKAGACLDVNAAALALFERSAAQLRGWGFAATMGRGIFPRNDPFPQALRDGMVMEFAMSYERRDGRPLHLECKAIPMVVGGGVQGAYVIGKDVTERVRVAEALAQQTQRMRALYTISAAHSAAEDLQIEAALQLALASFEMDGGFIAEIVRDRFVMQQSVGEGLFPIGHEIPVAGSLASEALRINDVFTIGPQNPSDALREYGWQSYVVMPLPEHAGYRGIVGFMTRRPYEFGEHDREFMRSLSSLLATLIERRSQRRRLARLAFRDHLTGLPNRAQFMRTLGDTVARAHEGGAAFALHCIDLDGFKALNDGAGHHAGDLALQEVARRLEQIVRRVDIAARLGGDEFVLLQGDVAHPSDAEIVGRRIVELLSEPYTIEGTQHRLGASVGVAVFPTAGRDATSLLRNADAALYRAKAAGKRCIELARAPLVETER